MVDIFGADDFCTEEVKILGAVLKWIDTNVTETGSDAMSSKDRSEVVASETLNGNVGEEHSVGSSYSSSKETSEDPPKKRKRRRENVTLP